MKLPFFTSQSFICHLWNLERRARDSFFFVITKRQLSQVKIEKSLKHLGIRTHLPLSLLNPCRTVLLKCFMLKGYDRLLRQHIFGKLYHYYLPRLFKNTSCKSFPVNLLYFPFFPRRSFLSKRTVNHSQSRTCTIKVVKQVEILVFVYVPTSSRYASCGVKVKISTKLKDVRQHLSR